MPPEPNGENQTKPTCRKEPRPPLPNHPNWLQIRGKQGTRPETKGRKEDALREEACSRPSCRVLAQSQAASTSSRAAPPSSFITTPSSAGGASLSRDRSLDPHPKPVSSQKMTASSESEAKDGPLTTSVHRNAPFEARSALSALLKETGSTPPHHCSTSVNPSCSPSSAYCGQGPLILTESVVADPCPTTVLFCTTLAITQLHVV